LQIAVFDYLKLFHRKTLRVVVTPNGIDKVASGNQRALGNVAGSDDPLPGVGHGLIGVRVEIADHRIYLYHLVDISRHDAVIVPLFL
jgi:hypothetical protein